MSKLYTVGGNLATLRSKALRWIDPYNPHDLPPGTLRVRTSDGNPPIKVGSYTTYETATLVPGTSDVYDVHKTGPSMYQVLYNSTNVVEVISANTSNIIDMTGMFIFCDNLTTVPLFDTSNVRDMGYMFKNCGNLTTVPLFDTSNVTRMEYMFASCPLTSVPLFNTSNVTNMEQMFSWCTSLTSVPLFDTSNVTNMLGMFYNCMLLTAIPLFNTANVTNMTEMFSMCVNVQSGALALYRQASTQANPPTNHTKTFYQCGANTETGAAELAQIPTNWKS